MVQKKAPLSLKEFMKSSLIVGYSCGSKKAMKASPHVLSDEEIRTMRINEGVILPRAGFMYSVQRPSKDSRSC